MDNQIRRGSLEMVGAMLISGTIGWFVLVSGQPVLDVVFWRCAIGAATLLVICGSMGFLRPGLLTWARFGWAVISGVARSEEHTSELQSLMRISYAVFCL